MSSLRVARRSRERRQNSNLGASPAGKKRKKHLLSGLIKCSCCGSSYTISGKDYYRCAGQKGRGTCTNTVSVRKEPIEAATLSILQHYLLTDEHPRVFVDEFRRKVARISDMTAHTDRACADRLAVITREIDNLAANMLAGVLSPTLLKEPATRRTATTLPHPALPQLLKEKVGRLRAARDDELVRGEAAEILSTLVESVTIYPHGKDGPEAEDVARVSDMLAWATNDNAARKGGVSSFVTFGCGDRI